MNHVSLQRSAVVSSGADLLSMLKVRTSRHHEELETALDLLASPLSRERFLHVIQRFFGFHRVWEPAIAAHEKLRAFHQSRQRTSLLRKDLVALGMSNAAIDELPLCDAARQCVADEDFAVGSIYVLEGSTLGGQIISRALANANWSPTQGLASFNPYGDGTGRMWREFRTFAEQAGEGGDRQRMVAGAQQTFILLKGWLTA
jgi:heme oxygenase